MSVQLAAHLERLIATGTFPTGIKLPNERALAAEFGVSRTTLREAMHELESKRLVERTPGRGTIVLDTGSDEAFESIALEGTGNVSHASELRSLLEPSLAALAARRATPATILQLHQVLDRTQDGISRSVSLALDIEFHLLVAQASANPLLHSLHKLATEWTSDIRLRSHATKEARRTSLLGHRSILAAIESHDEARAREAMSAHLADVARLINRTSSPKG
ncbi:FadR/GntR family transcriptional regulator [Nocardioides houyundeii]|uniref:FadR/GntR family transcriptional regulator n=1 Tax=Nocardioides houyundeii TaxID=2045452 RepID=UPI0019649114|nr:FCD domain-containing protein [Nocardioides houyundeii]